MYVYVCVRIHVRKTVSIILRNNQINMYQNKSFNIGKCIRLGDHINIIFIAVVTSH